MSDSRKDRRDARDVRSKGKDQGKGWTRERSRFGYGDEDEEFDWKKYTGNVKEIKLDEEDNG